MITELSFFRELSLVSILTRFLFAIASSALIGHERSKSRHAAGLRTHIIVCVASASIMMLNQYLLTVYNSNADPARLGAQVISGVGFLGAGSILITGHQRGQQIKGLTTAAGLWASACLGLVIGSGFFEVGVILSVILFTVIVALNRLNERYLKDYTVIRFYIEYTADVRFSSILTIIREQGWFFTNMEQISTTQSQFNGLFIDIQRTGHDSNRELLLEDLRKIDGVLSVMET